MGRNSGPSGIDLTGKIVTLEVQKGDKGLYGNVTKDGVQFLIFLPPSAREGQKIKVELQNTARKDKRGEWLFRGKPAPVEYRQDWRDNGDGTATQVTTSIDWLFRESEEGEVTTRALVSEERPNLATEEKTRKVTLGRDMASSYSEETVTRVIPIYTEYVTSQKQIDWKKSAERKESPVTTKHELGIYDPVGTYNTEKLRVNYPDDQIIFVPYRCQSFSDQVEVPWGQLPQWLRDLVLKDIPVCVCGRNRYNASNSDGYAKCEICREEEVCVRCGVEGRMKQVSRQLVCNKCEPYIQAESLIASVVTLDAKERISAMAEKLLTVDGVEGVLAEKLFAKMLEHIEDEYRQKRLLEFVSGYLWYYFTDDGVYATKFSPQALKLLSYFPQASGNGLVDFVAWLSGSLKPTVWDYYNQTQVNKQQASLPSFGDWLISLSNEPEKLVAKLVRGSENARLQVFELYSELQSRYGDGYEELTEVIKVLEADEQDFAKALSMLQNFEAYMAQRQGKIDAGEIWPGVEISASSRSRTVKSCYVIDSQGNIVDPETRTGGYGRKRYTSSYFYGDLATDHVVLFHEHDNYGYQLTETWEVLYLPKNLTSAQRTKIQELEEEHRCYFTGPGTGWNISKVGNNTYSTCYSRDLQGRDREAYNEMISSIIDVSKWDVRKQDGGEYGRLHKEVWFYKKTDPFQKFIAEAEDAVLSIKGELMSLEELAESGQAFYEETKTAWQLREQADPGTSLVQDGTVFWVRFVRLEEHQGRESLVAGPFFDKKSGTKIKLVLSPFCHATKNITEETTDFYVRVKPRNAETMPLFVYGGENNKVFGYWAEPVLAPENLNPKIKELETALANAETSLTDLKEKQRLHLEAESKKQAEKARAEVRDRHANVPDEHRRTRKTVETVIDYSSQVGDSFATLGDALEVYEVVKSQGGGNSEAVNIPQSYLAPGGETTFAHFEKRDFQCQREGCGAFVTLTASEMKAYKAGGFSKAVECPKCHATGTINS